jgi:hypothetical protein
VTGCPQKQTWWLVASSLLTLFFVYPVAATSNQLSTYSSLAVFSTPCGRWFDPGLVSHWSTLSSYPTIFFSLLTIQAASVREDLSCSSFGSYVCGLWGMKEIRVFPTSAVGQSQTLFLSVVEDYKL